MALFRLIAGMSSLAFGALGRSTYTLYVFLVGLLFLIGLGLVLLGFDLNTVDRWLESQGGLLDAIGTILLRVASGIALLLCILVYYLAISARLKPPPAPVELKPGEQPDTPPGWGCLLLAIPVAWFAWFGMTMDYS